MRLRKFFIGSALLLCIVAKAETVSLKQICGYDKFCGKLIDRGGELKQSDETLINLLKRNRSAITAAARRYGVDARAIVGAILAENTLNISTTDSVQNFLASSGIASGGKLFGKSIGTIGLGQINCTTAEHVEHYFSEKEKRSYNSSVCTELTSVGGSINNVAKIIRHAQDVYAANGMNIAGNVGILTTLYNLGQVEDRAARAKVSRMQPRLNYFGFFVLSQESALNEVVGKSPTSALTTAVAPIKSPNSKTAAASAADEQAAPDEKETAVVTSLRASQNFEIVDMVPACKEKNALFVRTPVNPKANQSTVSKGSEVSEVGRTVDCEMKAWVLVQASDGKQGWIKEADFLKATTKAIEIGVRECKLSDPKCANLTRSNSRYLLDTDDETGTQQMQIAMASAASAYGANSRGQPALAERKKISISDTSSVCFARNSKSGGENQTKRFDSPLTEAEVRSFIAKLEEKTKVWKTDNEKLAKAVNVLSDLYYCSEGCSVDKAQLTLYLASDGTGSVPEVARKMVNSNSLVPERDVAKIFLDCRNLFSKNYGITSLFNYALTFEDERAGPFDMSKAPTVAKLKVACEKELSASKASMQATAGCTTCNTKLISSQPSDELTNLITAQLSDISGGPNYGVSSEIATAREASRCVYSPGATLTQMRSFLESNCVDFVTAPDLTTFSILSKLYPGKVVLMSYPKKDRYAVHYKNSCKVVKGSKQ